MASYFYIVVPFWDAVSIASVYAKYQRFDNLKDARAEANRVLYSRIAKIQIDPNGDLLEYELMY